MRSSPEFDLIGAIRGRLGPGAGELPDRVLIGVGDDAAVTVPAGATATTVDALVDGVHFRRRSFPPEAIGHKAMASALSDLAAVGAEAGEAYVWLGRPEDLGREELLAICDGLAAVAAETGTVVAGGDITRSPALALSVTAVGHLGEREAVSRAGAKPGELVCLTGQLGAAAGLLLLERPELAAAVGDAEASTLRELQLYPRPRLDAGRALAAAGAGAMIDVSDGLGADAAHLAAASGVALGLELDRVPLAPGLAQLEARASLPPFELALGGEDYELLCTLPGARLAAASAAVAATGTTLTRIGTVSAGEGARLTRPDGRPHAPLGHDHFDR